MSRRKDIIPALSRALLRVEECKQRAEDPHSHEAEVERLSTDPAQVAMARDFNEKKERLALDFAFKQKRADEAFRALARTDLTLQDVKEVIKALRAYEELGLTMAQLKADWEKELRMHPWKAMT